LGHRWRGAGGGRQRKGQVDGKCVAVKKVSRSEGEKIVELPKRWGSAFENGARWAGKVAPKGHVSCDIQKGRWVRFRLGGGGPKRFQKRDQAAATGGVHLKTGKGLRGVFMVVQFCLQVWGGGEGKFQQTRLLETKGSGCRRTP